MRVVRSADARAFLEMARPLLAHDAEAEARHNLVLGIAATVAGHPDIHPVFLAWVALERDVPVAAATQTPPFNLVLADPLNDAALEAVVRAVVEDGVTVPGVVGNVPHAAKAAELWCAARGTTAEVVLSQGVYALTSVRDVPRASGAWRVGTVADRALLLRWLTDFADEALPTLRDSTFLERTLEMRLSSDDAGLWLWEEDGEPVSLAGFSGRTPSGIRIGPVYTPTAFRRQGYATTLVADLTRWLLERGHRTCFLYTDLANPTSNAIYARIGFERVCDSDEIAFADP